MWFQLGFTRLADAVGKRHGMDSLQIDGALLEVFDTAKARSVDLAPINKWLRKLPAETIQSIADGERPAEVFGNAPDGANFIVAEVCDIAEVR